MNYQLKLSSDRKPFDFSKFSKRKSYTKKRLRELGLGWFESRRREAKYLPYVLGEDEIIGGVVSGQSTPGHIMLVATNKRVIVLDCKPLFDNSEDITYFVVAGVSLGHVGPFYTITLHTRVGDFPIRTTNIKAAQNFKHYIDKRSIEHIKEVNGHEKRARL